MLQSSSKSNQMINIAHIAQILVFHRNLSSKFVDCVKTLFQMSGRQYILFRGPDSNFIGPERLKILQNLLTVCVHYILIRVCFCYKNNSGLMFTHQISHLNTHFLLFGAKNTFKFILSNSLWARKNRLSGTLCRLLFQIFIEFF